MYDIWYNYLKPKYDGKAKLCYMDRDIDGYMDRDS